MKPIDYLKKDYANGNNKEYSFNEFLKKNYYKIIYESNLFDNNWYEKNYPDVSNIGLDFIEHYIEMGAEENCKPNAFFDSEWYLNFYHDVKDSKLNPFIHYILYGQYEKRFTSFSDYLFSKSNFRKEIQINKIFKALSKNISIIIPIYNAFEDTKMCIESVLENTSGNYELILINDNSSDNRIEPLLANFSKLDNVKVITNKSNNGFVKNVNIGMNSSVNDVILLNSDTIVTKKWLQKLVALAYSKENIGTVTPVSNNAGAFSVPKINEENKIPDNLNIQSVGNIIEKSSKRVFMSAPTGNGFCMFIKRDTINSVGLFDEDNFGKGYCEENDFCMRAINKGWINVIDDTTYIYHKKGVSFSEKREKLIKKHRKILDKKHPTYTADVRSFLKSNEIQNVQKNADEGLNNFNSLKLDKKRILYVIHKATGGTPQTNKDLMSVVQGEYDCYLLTSDGSELILYHFLNGNLITLEKWNLNVKWYAEKFFIPEFKEVYYNILTKYSIDLIHIRHLIFHTFDLPYIADKLEIPVILSFHDFYFVCLSYNLIDGADNYCAGECTNSDNNCHIPMNNITQIDNMNNFVPTWRKEINGIFGKINHFITTSDVVRDIFYKTYPTMDLELFSVIEHGRDFHKTDKTLFEVPSTDKPIKILFIGNINKQKGSEIIKELNELDKDSKLELHFLGKTISTLKNIGIHHGEYARDELSKEIQKIKPSFIGIFSIWSETYCHTLSEAWANGIPVLSTKIGVLEERMERHDGGWFIDHNSMENTYNLILDIANNQNEYLSKLDSVEKISFKSILEMGDDYLNIYKTFI